MKRTDTQNPLKTTLITLRIKQEEHNKKFL